MRVLSKITGAFFQKYEMRIFLCDAIVVFARSENRDKMPENSSALRFMWPTSMNLLMFSSSGLSVNDSWFIRVPPRR